MLILKTNGFLYGSGASHPHVLICHTDARFISFSKKFVNLGSAVQRSLYHREQIKEKLTDLDRAELIESLD